MGVRWEPGGSEAGIDPSGLKASGGGQGFIPRATGAPLVDGGGTPGPHPSGPWTPPYWLVPPFLILAKQGR